MSPKAKQIRMLYHLNKITLAGLQKAYEDGDLTADEYTAIVGMAPTFSN